MPHQRPPKSSILPTTTKLIIKPIIGKIRDHINGDHDDGNFFSNTVVSLIPSGGIILFYSVPCLDDMINKSICIPHFVVVPAHYFYKITSDYTSHF